MFKNFSNLPTIIDNLSKNIQGKLYYLQTSLRRNRSFIKKKIKNEHFKK